ncbi:MAG: PAS domain-containing protein [Rhodospirillales bacterium]|nr:PAS domain-containing protein [Rhodospirillales bacterium]
MHIGCMGSLAGFALTKQRAASVDPAQPASAAVPQEFLERLPDPVIVLNVAREIVAVNRAARETLGIGLLGRDLALSLRHPDVLAAVETVASGLPSVTEEITLPMPIPRTFTLHAGTLHRDGVPTATDPQLPCVVLVLRDETRARRAEQSRADFVANASHELRSPLSALIGFIETLRGPASDDAIARDRFLGVMHAEAQRMARLVEDLMSLTRVEINEHVPPRHRVDLADVLIGVTETLVVRAEKRQMTIALDCPDDLPPVIGETDQLTQVFHNLIDNAVKYARAGTQIRITARPVERLPSTQAAGVKISVTDAGEGIPAIHLPRLTERFYRADEGRSRRLGGTGLGLAIVKHIVNRHRGRLSIDSIVGEGSTFNVFLPALPRPIASPNGDDDDGDSRPDPLGVTKL